MPKDRKRKKKTGSKTRKTKSEPCRPDVEPSLDATTGFLLNSSTRSPNGFSYTGSRIRVRQNDIDWIVAEPTISIDSQETLVGHGVWLYALSPNGRFSRFMLESTSGQLTREQLPDLPWEETRDFAMCATDAKVTVAGGERAGNKTGDVFEFDLAARKWSQIAPLQIARSHLGLAYADGHIHALGGLRNWGPFHNQVSKLHETFSPVSGSWAFAKSLPVRCHSMGLASDDGAIALVGGESNLLFGSLVRFKVPVIRVYLTSEKRWHRLGRLPFGRSSPGVTLSRGELLVFGGQTWKGIIADTEVIHLLSGQQTCLTPLVVPREGPGCSHIDGWLVVAGGAETGSEHGIVERRLIGTELFIHQPQPRRAGIIPE